MLTNARAHTLIPAACSKNCFRVDQDQQSWCYILGQAKHNNGYDDEIDLNGGLACHRKCYLKNTTAPLPLLLLQASEVTNSKDSYSYRKALFVLVFIGNVNQEGYYGRVPLHQLHHEVEAQMHTLTDQALMPCCTAADQSVQ